MDQVEMSALKVDYFFQLDGSYEKITKGSYLFLEGQKASKFYIVTKGKLKISKFSGDGKELSLRLANKHSIIGELTLFSPDPSYLFNAKALEDSEVYGISNKVLEDFLLREPTFTLDFMRVMSEHIRKQHTKFRDLLMYGKKGALYSTLIRLTNSYGVQTEEGITIRVPLTNQELANYSCTTRESVNRMLVELKEMGIISTKGKVITICDLDFLKSEINCEGCPPSICRID